MKKPLEFRVRLVKKNKWLEEDFILSGDGKTGEMNKVEWDWQWECFYESASIVDGECVVQQFTGKLDKNNKKIFEGDIVVVEKIYQGDVKFKRLIVWNISSCGLGMIGQDKIEIIGNIFENKDLLI